MNWSLKDVGKSGAVAIAMLWVALDFASKTGYYEPVPLRTQPQQMDEDSRARFMKLSDQVNDLHYILNRFDMDHQPLIYNRSVIKLLERQTEILERLERRNGNGHQSSTLIEQHNESAS